MKAEDLLSMSLEQLEELDPFNFKENNTYSYDSNSDCIKCYRCCNCSGCINCTDSFNCSSCSNCQACYDCTKCSDSVGCQACYDCTNCGDCNNCKRCINCKNCEGCIDCVGIQNGINLKYMAYGVQLTKSQYKKFVEKFQKGNVTWDF